MFSFVTTTHFAGNELWRILVFFTVILLSLITGRVAQAFMTKTKSRYSGQRITFLNTLLNSLSKPTVLACFTIGFTMGTSALVMNEVISSAVATVSRIMVVLAVGYTVYSLVDILDFYLENLSDKTESKVDNMLFPLVGKSVRITISAVIALQAIQALSDRPITSIVAGLGVGGLAIALAGQETIKNFFGSLVIILDKPFEIGDRIIIDGHDGEIESVGFRSTKVRTLDGHLVTVPNGELVNKTIQNIGKRPYIRRVTDITVTYDTSPVKLDLAQNIIKEILKDHEGMSPEYPPRVYFSDFNDCSLNIKVIYWYFPPDYWQFMDFSDRVNKAILAKFNEEGIEFAFPTQTIHVAQK